jgi:hypothetical protein
MYSHKFARGKTSRHKVGSDGAIIVTVDLLGAAGLLFRSAGTCFNFSESRHLRYSWLLAWSEGLWRRLLSQNFHHQNAGEQDPMVRTYIYRLFGVTDQFIKAASKLP